MLMHNHCRKNV